MLLKTEDCCAHIIITSIQETFEYSEIIPYSMTKSLQCTWIESGNKLIIVYYSEFIIILKLMVTVFFYFESKYSSN